MKNTITLKFLEALYKRGFNVKLGDHYAVKTWRKWDDTQVASSIVSWFDDGTTIGNDAIESMTLGFGGASFTNDVTPEIASTIYEGFLDDKKALHEAMGDEQ